MNEAEVATYRRLMEAEELIATARLRRGESDARIDAALEASEVGIPDDAEGEDLYLGALARYVAALGGRLEVAAVFPDETIRLAGEPQDPGPASAA